MNTKEILSDLLNISSPSGFEYSIRNTIKSLVSLYVDKTEEDVHGNLICYKNGIFPESKTLMLIAHMDEVGLMISYIEESGMIRLTNIGCIDERLLRGRVVKINNKDNIVIGIIGAHPVHMKRSMEKKDFPISELWVDIGAQNKEEAQKLVSIGNNITLDSSPNMLQNNILVGRGCDDKAGAASLIKVLELIAKENIEHNIVVVFSAQEEVGLRGARTASYHVSPDICIGVDAVHATDYPMVSKAIYGDIRLGKGPVISIGTDFTPSIQDHIIGIASKLGIDSQICAQTGASGTDINAVQVTKDGCATGMISIPCRYMHTPVETISMQDIESISTILSEICKNPFEYLKNSL